MLDSWYGIPVQKHRVWLQPLDSTLVLSVQSTSERMDSHLSINTIPLPALTEAYFFQNVSVGMSAFKNIVWVKLGMNLGEQTLQGGLETLLHFCKWSFTLWQDGLCMSRKNSSFETDIYLSAACVSISRNVPNHNDFIHTDSQIAGTWVPDTEYAKFTLIHTSRDHYPAPFMNLKKSKYEAPGYYYTSNTCCSFEKKGKKSLVLFVCLWSITHTVLHSFIKLWNINHLFKKINK